MSYKTNLKLNFLCFTLANPKSMGLLFNYFSISNIEA